MAEKTDNSNGTILFMVRSDPRNLCYLFKDEGGIAIRSMVMDSSGQTKGRTIAMSHPELESLANFVMKNSQLISTT